MTTATAAPLSEEAFLRDVRARQARIWPAGVPREAQWPLGEISLTECLRERARRRPDLTLYQWYGRAFSYAEIDRLSDRFAALLQAEGVAPGTSVAVFLGNCPQFAVAFFGILKAGCVHVPVNPMFKEHELLHELNDARAEVIVADHALMDLVDKVRPQTGVRRVLGTSPATVLPETPAIPVPEAILRAARSSHAEEFLDALERAGAPAPVTLDLDAVAALNYTGGTTGMPKGCIHTHRDMVFTAAKAIRTNVPLDEGDVCVNFHPLFWIAGEDLGIILPVFAGATCVLLGRWDPVGFMAAVDRFKAIRAVMLVDNAAEVLEHPRVGDFDLTSLKTTGVSSFVKKLNLDWRTRWRALTGATMAELSYGMTETHTLDTFTEGLQADDFDLSLQPIMCGLPVAETDFVIRDFDTRALLPLGAEGEIWVRSPSLLKGYLNRPDATAESLVDGWLRTGDIGCIDEHGLVHFLGRRKEMLKVKGMSVFPAEIEALLGRHPAVIGSGVIGRPDAERGQVPVAFVILDPARAAEVTAEALATWCAEAMATYKKPEIRVVDSLPMTATGKVKKGELEKLL